MGTREEWDAVAARLRDTAEPFQEPEFAALWTLACTDAPKVLGRFRRAGRIDEARIADLAGDLLLRCLPALLEADNPRGYFATALVNAARSWLRRGSSRLASPAEGDSSHDDSHSRVDPPDHALLIDVADFVHTLSEREREVLRGVAHDEDRVALARRLGISRANLDQIVSRARRRFRWEEP